MTGYIRTSKGKRRPPISTFALALLRRVSTWQRDAGIYATPGDIVAAGGRRDWITLQSLMRRGLLNLTDVGRIRITNEGRRYLRLHND